MRGLICSMIKFHQTRHCLGRNSQGFLASALRASSSHATDPVTEANAAASWRRALLFTSPTHVLQIKGVSFEDRQDCVQKLVPKQAIVVAPDPSNPADPHALGVYTADMQHLGFIARHLAPTFPREVPVCFGHVVSSGRVVNPTSESAELWGATITCKPSVHGLWLDLLPDSWQSRANLDNMMEEVLGSDWPTVKPFVGLKYRHRCAISSMPQEDLQLPLQVVPQWIFDLRKKKVYLGGLLPISAPVLQLKEQLAVAGQQLLAGRLQLEHESGVAWENDFDMQAQLLASIPDEQRQAIRQLAAWMCWNEQDCCAYVMHAAQRQQELAQGGWELEKPSVLNIAYMVQVDGQFI